MKKLGLMLLLVVGLASPATGGQIQIGYGASAYNGYAGSAYGPYQTGLGGEFTFNPLISGAWLDTSLYGTATSNIGVIGSFQTFCIEGGEVIYPYGATYNAVVNQNAVQGGTGNKTGDPVSVGTGWLYSQFARGALAGYDYDGAGRLASADALQRAIWWLEGEEGITYDGSNIFMAAVVAKFTTNLGAMADGAQNYGVYALNLTDANGLAQDGLFYVPDGGTTLTLLGCALMGLGALRRRFSV